MSKTLLFKYKIKNPRSQIRELQLLVKSDKHLPFSAAVRASFHFHVLFVFLAFLPEQFTRHPTVRRLGVTESHVYVFLKYFTRGNNTYIKQTE